MQAKDWMRSKAVVGNREFTDSQGTVIVNTLRFEGFLPYRMRQNLKHESCLSGILPNGSEFSERIVTIRDKVGNYKSTIYIYEEYTKQEAVL